LTLDRGEDGLLGAREGVEEGVSLGVDLVAAVPCEGLTQKTLMVRQDLGVAGSEPADERGRPLHIGEEERGRAAGKARHRA
jgi:hypothetical protein